MVDGVSQAVEDELHIVGARVLGLDDHWHAFYRTLRGADAQQPCLGVIRYEIDHVLKVVLVQLARDHTRAVRNLLGKLGEASCDRVGARAPWNHGNSPVPKALSVVFQNRVVRHHGDRKDVRRPVSRHSTHDARARPYSGITYQYH